MTNWSCPNCHGELTVSDAVYADCRNCGESVLRNEVEL